MSSLINVKPTNITPSYDWIDTTSGIGFKRVYPYNVSGATANTTVYGITDQAVGSGRESIYCSHGNSLTMAEVGHFDFDMTFSYQLDQARVLVSNAMVNVCAGMRNENAAARNREGKMAVEMYRIRNGVSTFLVSQASGLWCEGFGGAGNLPLKNTISRDLCFQLPIPETKIKKNDIIRTRFILYSKEGDTYGETLYTGMGCDPKGRTDYSWPRIVTASYATCTSIDLPFKIIT